MTLHIPYNYQCSQCEAFYIPYDATIDCPNCGAKTPATDVFASFIERAADSARFNLRSNDSYIPGAWYIGSYGDHILSLLFRILEIHRTQEAAQSFAEVARQCVDDMQWGDQQYARDHIYQIALKVHEQLEQDE